MHFYKSQSLYIILTLCLLAYNARSQAWPDPYQKYSPEQLKSDLHILKTVLEQAHPSFYDYQNQEQWNRIFETAENKLDHDLTAIEFRNILAPLIYQTHCDHTYIDFDSASYTFHQKKELQFPFRIKVFHNHIYVSKNLSRDSSIAFGSEILSINNMPARKVLKRLLYTESADGYNITKLQWAVQMEFHDKYSLFIGPTSTYTIQIRQPGNMKIETRMVQGLSHDSIFRFYRIRYPAAWAERSKPLQLKLSSDKLYATMKITHLRFRNEDSSFYRFLDSSIKVLNNNGIRKLILDMRDNNGGEAVAGKELYARLSDYPFSYFDSMTEATNKRFQYADYTDLDTGYYTPWQYAAIPGQRGFSVLKHPLFGIQNPHAPNYSGELYVLVNGGSMSATTIFCDIVHTNRRAVFIGEECGGGYSACNGNAVSLTLPASKVALSIPLRKFYISVKNNRFKTKCLAPDYEVKQGYTDFINGNDRVMDFTLKLIKRVDLIGF